MRTWTTDDTWLFHQGTHATLHELLGAFPLDHGGASGTLFRVWAPEVSEVRVVGDWCGYDHAQGAPMQRIPDTAVFEVRVPAARVGHTYKLRILGRDGSWHEKADPCAAWSEVAPRTASRIAHAVHTWEDDAWLARRASSDPWHEPVSIYEVHLGSWADRREAPADMPLYRWLAPKLAEHARSMGFTHVELMPIMEHPFEGSWGYQVLGYFAPTARFGSPDDFRWFVDHLHSQGIGVLLDWVPAHFPTDAHGMYRFTGEAVYEHPDPRRGYHPDWTTAIFDYGRPEVRSFLLSNAVHWVEGFHADGLRVDAVASMLYLDYSREPGEWLPNAEGGNENHDAVTLIRAVAAELGRRQPKALLIAEESTSWPGVSQPVADGGLGFGFKWDMGWMNDTLRYMAREPVHRRHHHDELTFRAMYQYSERFILPLSHDEVVHGKSSLLGRMPGDRWQQFSNLRALLALMYAQPGKKLLFMGTELAPDHEWSHERSLPWDALHDPAHAGVRDLIQALNHAYANHPALHHGDTDGSGFHWVDGSDATRSLYAWLRLGPEGAPPVLVAANLTPIPRVAVHLGVPVPGDWHVLLDTDSTRFGGSGYGRDVTLSTIAEPCHGFPHRLVVDQPPLSVLFIKAPGPSR